MEGKVDPVERIEGNYALVVDGMAYVQQAQVNIKTFGEFVVNLLERILLVGKAASRVDVVFMITEIIKLRMLKGIEDQEVSFFSNLSLHPQRSNNGMPFYLQMTTRRR